MAISTRVMWGKVFDPPYATTSSVYHHHFLRHCIISTAHLVATTIAFRNKLLGQNFSAQCIINGLPRRACVNEIDIQILRGHRSREHGVCYYVSSTFMALSFILQEGIATELDYSLVGNLPLVGWYREEDRNREFQRVSKHVYFRKI
jgi:hypothetical protein